MIRGALLSILALSGCVGPRREVPDAAAVALPNGWREATNVGKEVDDRWWRSFDDPLLTSVVEEALDRNDEIAVAVQRVEEARAQFALARSQELPTVDLGAAGSSQRALNPFGVGTDQSIGQVQASVSYDVDLFGRLRSLDAAARASLLSSGAARDAVRLAIAASAASGYLTLQAMDARVLVLRKTLTARSQSLELANERAKRGYAPLLDVAQAASDFHAAEQLLPAAQMAVRTQENGLSVLMGRLPGPVARSTAFEDGSPPDVAALLPSLLLRRRPDVKQAEEEVVAADRRLDAARAAFLPNIRLTGAGGLVSSTLLPNPVSLFSLGGSVLAPIFEGGRLRAQEDLETSRRNAAAFAYRATVLKAVVEVEDALTRTRLLADQEVALRRQLQAQQTVLQVATSRYRAGYSPYLEQLDAQRSLLSVELLMVQLRADRLTNCVSLIQALGGGWREERLSGSG